MLDENKLKTGKYTRKTMFHVKHCVDNQIEKCYNKKAKHRKGYQKWEES